jgi:hypothetical protein
VSVNSYIIFEFLYFLLKKSKYFTDHSDVYNFMYLCYVKIYIHVTRRYWKFKEEVVF